MNYDLIFLLEEESMRAVLEVILPKLTNKTFRCIAHQGKQDLAQSIPRKLKVFQNINPETKFIIVHDQDSHDCVKLKNELKKLCSEVEQKNVLIRIVCRELESWFLGDLAAVEKAYELQPNRLRKQQNKNKFRNPDRLNCAKQELKSLVQEYYQLHHAKKIAPHLSITDNCSHSFCVFIEGIQKILD
jgi:hypothetical protein